MCEQSTTCERPSKWWVQSTVTVHNGTTCTAHLPATIRRYEEMIGSILKDDDGGDRRYWRQEPGLKAVHPRDARFRGQKAANYALVTVKGL